MVPVATTHTAKSVSSEPGHRVPEAAVDPHHQMQMAASGKARGTDVADDLAFPDALTHMDYVAAGVVVARRHIPATDVAVVNHQPIAVAGVVVPLSDSPGMGSADRCATGSPEVGAIVQLPVMQYRMEPHSKRRGNPSRHGEGKAVARARRGGTSSMPGRVRSPCA